MTRWVMQSVRPLMADLGDTVRPTTRAAIRSAAEFDACFTREYVGLVRLVWLIVGSQPAAEDAVQDAFVALHRRWADVQRPGAFVRTAALNNARRVARRATVERRLVRRALPLAGSHSAPDEPLADALRRLPLRQRTAVVLRYYADYDELHIAAVLGCAPGTVKSLLSRAKTALRDSLGEGEIR